MHTYRLYRNKTRVISRKRSANWSWRTKNVPTRTVPIDTLLYKRKKQRRPNFPGGRPPSIIGAKELNYCVRDGNRCDLLAIVTAFSYLKVCTLKIEQHRMLFKTIWSSYRPISINQLNTLPCLHLWPINVVVSHGSYHNGGNLILRGASHLDAFSAYPVHT